MSRLFRSASGRIVGRRSWKGVTAVFLPHPISHARDGKKNTPLRVQSESWGPAPPSMSFVEGSRNTASCHPQITGHRRMSQATAASYSRLCPRAKRTLHFCVLSSSPSREQGKESQTLENGRRHNRDVYSNCDAFTALVFLAKPRSPVRRGVTKAAYHATKNRGPLLSDPQARLRQTTRKG